MCCRLKIDSEREIFFRKQVFGILSQMPRIEFVNLSLNRLETPIVQPPPCHMTNLRSLVLNNTKLNWFTVDELLKLLPSLEELHLSLNEYTHVLLDTVDDEDDQGNNNNNCKPSEECICDDETPTSLGSEGDFLQLKRLIKIWLNCFSISRFLIVLQWLSKDQCP